MITKVSHRWQHSEMVFPRYNILFLSKREGWRNEEVGAHNCHNQNQWWKWNLWAYSPSFLRLIDSDFYSASQRLMLVPVLTICTMGTEQTVKLSIDFSRICVMERTTGLMVVPSVRKVSKSMPFTSHGQTGNREFINKLKSANISVIPHFCNKWLCSLPKLYMIYTCVKF